MKIIKQNKELKALLDLYEEMAGSFKSKNNNTLKFEIVLTPRFLKICRCRIILGHKKYGNDWQQKDCLKELEFEKFDIFNYMILHMCQQQYKKRKDPSL